MSKKQKYEDEYELCIDGLVEKEDQSERSEVCVSVYVHMYLHITNDSTYMLYVWMFKKVDGSLTVGHNSFSKLIWNPSRLYFLLFYFLFIFTFI